MENGGCTETYGGCALDDVAAVVSFAGLKTEPFAGLFGFAQFLFETVVVDNRRRRRTVGV